MFLIVFLMFFLLFSASGTKNFETQSGGENTMAHRPPGYQFPEKKNKKGVNTKTDKRKKFTKRVAVAKT